MPENDEEKIKTLDEEQESLKPQEQTNATMPQDGIPNALEVTNDLPDGFQAVESENIKAIRVVPDPSHGHPVHGLVEIQVIFRRGGPKGSRYHYQQVPEALAEQFRTAPSLTGFLNSQIKPHFPFYRADYDSGLPYKAETV